MLFCRDLQAVTVCLKYKMIDRTRNGVLKEIHEENLHMYM